VRSIPVIDIFAGPGGLGEGLTSVVDGAGRPIFRIALSIEKDPVAHETLRLRSFFRTLGGRYNVPDAYFRYLRGGMSHGELFAAWPEHAAQASREAWCAELGMTPADTVDARIREALQGSEDWVLIGGPPCQAYSLVGRSRSGTAKNQQDKRHFLFEEYLRILRKHRPVAFVMENVKGLLSARVAEDQIVERILNDLSAAGYDLHCLSRPRQGVLDGGLLSGRDFVVRCEDHGVPQARHRVIIVGTRKDVGVTRIPYLKPSAQPATVRDAFRGLAPLRSTLSRRSGGDSPEGWSKAIAASISGKVLSEVRRFAGEGVAELLNEASSEVDWTLPEGNRFVSHPVSKGRWDGELWSWLYSPRLRGACNHHARSHMGSDLGRYLFASCFAEVTGRSPGLGDFPPSLLPKHRNVMAGARKAIFGDRFRVQLWDQPASTVVAHIAKDGHYFIHPDRIQCRSLTVREAARLQTFPDDYFFEGPRTEQFKQVGNAVPPLLARKIAEQLYAALSSGRVLEGTDGGQDHNGTPQLEHVAHRGA